MRVDLGGQRTRSMPALAAKEEDQLILVGRHHCSHSPGSVMRTPANHWPVSPHPCRSPALIGCFIVDRQYFQEIGLLDEGMEVYGGENVELGIRVSRVSHPLGVAQLSKGQLSLRSRVTV